MVIQITLVGRGDAHLKLIRVVACFSQQTADRDNGKRFIVRADEKLTAFLELESQTVEARAELTAGEASGLPKM